MGLKATTCCVGSRGLVRDLLAMASATVRESMVSSTFGAADLGGIDRRGGDESGDELSDIR